MLLIQHKNSHNVTYIAYIDFILTGYSTGLQYLLLLVLDFRFTHWEFDEFFDYFCPDDFQSHYELGQSKGWIK